LLPAERAPQTCPATEIRTTSGAGHLNARGSTGQSACLRSRRVQVQVLPGVLCPKQKRPMHRDVAPEEAGSSPVGHPQYGVLTHCRRYDGCVARQSPYATNAVPAALAQLGEAPGLGPGGSGFESLGPHGMTDTKIADLAAPGRAHWKGGGTR
jgi:hypothetical protein